MGGDGEPLVAGRGVGVGEAGSVPVVAAGELHPELPAPADHTAPEPGMPCAIHQRAEREEHRAQRHALRTGADPTGESLRPATFGAFGRVVFRSAVTAVQPQDGPCHGQRVDRAEVPEGATEIVPANGTGDLMGWRRLYPLGYVVQP
ncbi:hypothetical protein GCM10010277_76240 [Streptomyces longisporoflavus]|nr:hypothetical protein GCM10010277_76240 [Streptomyces longisporoflavus]